MHQVKIFKGVENDLVSLEDQVNRWLAESQVRVVNVFGNMAPQSTSPGPVQGLSSGGFNPSDVMMVVLYEKKPAS